MLDVMADLADALNTIDELNVFSFPPRTAQPPFAFVNLPSVSYDLTFGRGTDRFTFEVYVCVGQQLDEASRDLLADYVSTSSDRSIKNAIELHRPGVRVTGVTFTSIELGSGGYAAAVFVVDYAA